VGNGQTLFHRVQRPLGLTLKKTRAFGKLWYPPAPA
jgi:hypothetical protein